MTPTDICIPIYLQKQLWRLPTSTPPTARQVMADCSLVYSLQFCFCFVLFLSRTPEPNVWRKSRVQCHRYPIPELRRRLTRGPMHACLLIPHASAAPCQSCLLEPPRRTCLCWHSIPAPLTPPPTPPESFLKSTRAGGPVCAG